MGWFSSPGDEKFKETSERLEEYDRRADRDPDEAARLEQENYEASLNASWWLRGRW